MSRPETITPALFLGQWMTYELLDARFGLLNGLETGTLKVVTWNDEETTEGFNKYLDFLIRVAREGTDGRGGAKALQILLKLYKKDAERPSGFSPQWHHPYVDRVVELLANPAPTHFLLTEPFSRMAKTILDHSRPTDSFSEKDLEEKKIWVRAVILTQHVGLFDELGDGNGHFPRTWQLAIETLEELAQKGCENRSDLNLSDFIALGNDYYQAGPLTGDSGLYARTWLLMKARRGDFNKVAGWNISANRRRQAVSR